MEGLQNFLANLVIPRKVQPKLDEATFFVEAFKPLNREEWELVKKHEDKLWRPMYGSVVFGIMLSLSLRRYLPRLRAASFSTKSLLDIGLVLTSTGFTAINFAVPRYLNAISDYLRFLKQKYLRYQDVYPKEIQVFQEFMKEESFVKWYSDSPQYLFENGHEPTEANFSKNKPTKPSGKLGNDKSHGKAATKPELAASGQKPSDQASSK